MTDTALKWPADKIERRDIETLIPYARNSNTHSDRQIDQIAASIREWGWTMPILVDEEGTILAGHGRVQAARRLGIEEVPVMVAEGWTETQRRAYVIADNRLAEISEWDTEALRLELGGIAEDDPHALDLTGFDQDSLNALIVTSAPDVDDPTRAPVDTEGQAERNDDTADAFDSEEGQFRLVASFMHEDDAHRACRILANEDIPSHVVEL